MRHLLATVDQHFIAGIDHRAYAIIASPAEKSSTIFELIQENNAVAKEDGAKENGDDASNHRTVQGVAAKLIQDNDEFLYFAVSRMDKTICIYNIPLKQSSRQCNENDTSRKTMPIPVHPIITHKTTKRCCALSFATIASREKENSNSRHILIAGDFAGDVTGFFIPPGKSNSTYSKKMKRLLLGHTASIVTYVKVVDDVCFGENQIKLFTADRDEKIRISLFPDTHIVEGYLLGHTEFISSMDILTSKNWCVTCSGDDTIRFWDYNRHCEISTINLKSNNKNDSVNKDSSVYQEDNEQHEEGMNVDEVEVKEDTVNGKKSRFTPIDVTINRQGSLLAVAFNESYHIDLYSIKSKQTNQKNDVTVKLCERIEFSSQPLAVSFLSDNSLLILLSEPDFITKYLPAFTQTDGHDKMTCKTYTSNMVSSYYSDFRSILKSCKVEMPCSLLETDTSTGKFKLKKNAQEEKEGFVKHEPW
eukprot:CAMPEP_0184868388 /NCGR_PEP_ID=MMETSP0580-20130426/30245_1 /TAXON_ID=1118495 /ORGANISM="Dactyliosolen fragilissimus" /LENGTH=474 /DNA_ID=CAMNT_0027369239 /DNA_START=12 /DNA_END=1433 /DNA_ORIENTATION=-